MGPAVFSELLSELGLELDWAEDGQICLDKFRNSPEGYYDAVLMDIRMPHMAGYEATTAIRGLDHPNALSVPIIAMSADAFKATLLLSAMWGFPFLWYYHRFEPFCSPPFTAATAKHASAAWNAA